MYVGNHQVAHSLVDEPVAAQRRQAGKSVGHHQHREVPATVRGAGMAGMQPAVVDDLDALWIQRLEALQQSLGSRCRHGNTRTNGLTS